MRASPRSPLRKISCSSSKAATVSTSRSDFSAVPIAAAIATAAASTAASTAVAAAAIAAAAAVGAEAEACVRGL